MSKKRQITNRTFVLTAVLGSFLILVLVTANTIMSSKRASVATDEAVSKVSAFYLEAMADRRAQTIANLIEENFEEMEKAVAFIAREQITTQDELRHAIGTVRYLLSIDRFSLVDEDDIVYTQSTTYTGRTRHVFLSEVGENERVTSIMAIYGSSKQMCLAIPTPGLTLMGKPFKACFVQLDIDDIVDLLAFVDPGRTYFAVYASNGANLSGTELGPAIADHNLFEATQGSIAKDDWELHRKNFQDGAAGTMRFAIDGVEETLCYVPVEGTNWELAVLIRDSVIQDQIRDVSEDHLEISQNQILFTLVSALILAAILLWELRQLSREQLEEEKEAAKAFRELARTDALTGAQSKNAYAEREEALDKRLKAGEEIDLAVVVGDINGLKYVNDTQGHAAGDQLIKDACALICEYFDKESVYRVGGDEFVIILEGDDCKTLTEKIDELDRIVEANIAKDAVVISFGYAHLEQGDGRLRDVFDRADQMMYERKEALKEMGAHGRH